MSDAPNLVPHMATDPPITDHAVERYLLLLAAQRSPRTVDAYRRDLAALAAFARAPVSTATAASLEAWVASMRAAGLAPSTIGRRIAAVRSYFRHEQLLGARDDNPAAELETPRRVRKLPRSARGVVPLAASTSRSDSDGESVRGSFRTRRGVSSSAAGLSSRAPRSCSCRKYDRTAAIRRPIVEGARPAARIEATHASSDAAVAVETGARAKAARAARSRRYASTVRGERCAASRSR